MKEIGYKTPNKEKASKSTQMEVITKDNSNKENAKAEDSTSGQTPRNTMGSGAKGSSTAVGFGGAREGSNTSVSGKMEMHMVLAYTYGSMVINMKGSFKTV